MNGRSLCCEILEYIRCGNTLAKGSLLRIPFVQGADAVVARKHGAPAASGRRGVTVGQPAGSMTLERLNEAGVQQAARRKV